jgi:hypothetical protein
LGNVKLLILTDDFELAKQCLHSLDLANLFLVDQNQFKENLAKQAEDDDPMYKQWALNQAKVMMTSYKGARPAAVILDMNIGQATEQVPHTTSILVQNKLGRRLRQNPIYPVDIVIKNTDKTAILKNFKKIVQIAG